jgi:hypothetical protein
VPSAVVASATYASVPSSKAVPTVIDQSCSRPATIPGSASIHHAAPAAIALFRTTAGNSIGAIMSAV